MSHIKLNNLVKRYGSIQTLHGIDLDIEEGEFTVLVGPSGCGKSTLLRMIAGLEEITDGELYVNNQYINDVDAAERGVAMVFQNYALYPHMSVAENMGFALKIAGEPKEQIRARVEKAANILHLTEYLERKPKALSGGQRQRVAIGRAIVRQPDIFLFDEPLSNLDAALRVNMRVELAKLHHTLGNTMIYVTHDQTEAMTMADKIVVMNAGRIEQIGSPLELYNHPHNTFVAGFLGMPKINMLDAVVEAVDNEKVTVKTVSDTRITLDRVETAVSVGEKLTLGIRPDYCVVSSRDENSIHGSITVTEQMGGHTLIYSDLDNGQQFTLKIEGQLSVKHGQSVKIGLNPDMCYLFNEAGKNIRTILDQEAASSLEAVA